MSSWDFLTEALKPDALLLDCRSEEAHNRSTVKDAHGVAVIKKPFGSGPRSMSMLSAFVERVLKLAEDKNSITVLDEGQGMYACRMAWILYTVGYRNINIFARKFSDIPGEFLGQSRGQISAEPDGNGTAREFPGLVPIAFVQQNLTRVQLLDVRTPDEYEGRLPRLTNPDPGGICGRIPGSVNWDWRTLYGPDGYLRDKFTMIQQIRAMGLIQERPTVIYDYNGARSCTTALILRSCGYRQVHVYLGSWMEWRKSNLPKQNMGNWTP